MKKDIVSLCIELDQINNRLDKIKNDPNYIDGIVKKVYNGKPKRDYSKELQNIINNYL